MRQWGLARTVPHVPHSDVLHRQALLWGMPAIAQRIPLIISDFLQLSIALKVKSMRAKFRLHTVFVVEVSAYGLPSRMSVTPISLNRYCKS
jgi:hypothetical protein